MTSKISFFKQLKAEIKNRGWLIALAAFLCAVVFPVNYQLQIDHIANAVYTDISSAEIAGMMQLDKISVTLDIFGAGNNLTMIMTVIGAAFCAAAFFSYLHSREKTDFYHSLAVRRETHFAVRYTGGLLTALIPYIICVLIGFFGIGSIAGTVNAETAANTFGAVGFFCMSFSAVYTLCVLAMLITGRLLIGIGGMVFFAAYAPVCIQLAQYMMSRFFKTYYVPAGTENIAVYFSPVTLMTRIGYDIENGSDISPLMWIILAAFIVGGIALCIFVYRKRPSETAENALVHTSLESIFKVAICIPGAIALASVVEFFTGYDSNIWFIVSALLSAFLINGVIEFIYHFDLRNIIRHKVSGVIALGGTAFILALLISDPFGFDSWQPDIGDVKSMSLYSYSMTEPLSEYYTSNESEDFYMNQELENFSPIYELVREAIDKQDESYSYNTVTEPFNVCYTLKDGSKHYRYYTVQEADLETMINELSLSGEFREKYYPSAWPEVIKADSVEVTDWKNFGMESQKLSLSPDEITMLKDLYREETNALSFYDIAKSQPVLNLTFTKDRDNSEDYWQFGNSEVSCFIYPQCEKTIQFLNEHGMTQKPVVASDVASLILDVPEKPSQTADIGSENSEAITAEDVSYSIYNSYQFFTESEIKQVLSSIERCRFYISEDGYEPCHIMMTLKDGYYIDAYCIITDAETITPLFSDNIRN